jgi:DNA-binding HxlR family transcriptional regulator
MRNVNLTFIMQAKSPYPPAEELQKHCSIGRAVDLIGDAWTFLIIRELFWKSTRFDEISESTGMASNILSNRLKKLLLAGIITKTPTPDDARRSDYALTAKGLELFPVIMTMMSWGDRWSCGDKGPLVELKHIACGKRTKPGLTCSNCGEALRHDTVRTNFAKAYRIPQS